MGAFYVNYVARAQAEQIADAFKGRSALVSQPVGGCVVAYDELSDAQDEKIIRLLAKHLSDRCSTPVWAVVVHDDDVLFYWLADRGEIVDDYNSNPDYWESDLEGEPRGPIGGNSAKLSAAFGSVRAAEVDRLLRRNIFADPPEDGEDIAFESQRHQRLAALLGIPVELVSLGYGDLQAGFLPPGMTNADFTTTA